MKATFKNYPVPVGYPVPAGIARPNKGIYFQGNRLCLPVPCGLEALHGK